MHFLVVSLISLLPCFVKNFTNCLCARLSLAFDRMDNNGNRPVVGYFFWVSFFGYGCHLSNFPCFRKSSHLKMNCSPVCKSLLRCSHNCLSGLVQRFYHILVLFSAAKFTLNDRLDVNFFYILKLKSFCFSVQASVNNSLPKTTFFIQTVFPCYQVRLMGSKSSFW